MVTSVSTSSSLNTIERRSESSCTTPIDSSLLLISGAHMMDRMRKSKTLWLLSKRSSFPASRERIGCLDSITWLQMVRLMRISSSSCSYRVLNPSGFNAPLASLSMMKPRSASVKSSNRKSRIFDSISSRPMASLRACVILVMALSLSSASTFEVFTVWCEGGASADMTCDSESSARTTELRRGSSFFS